MPVIQREVPLLTLTNSPNLLQGSTFELMRGNVFITAGCTASVTGGFITIFSGADLVLEESPPFVSTTYPVIPDQMAFTDFASIADRIVIAARNPSGGTITFRPLVQITALAG
jgi:hypothetical protein